MENRTISQDLVGQGSSDLCLPSYTNQGGHTNQGALFNNLLNF